MGTHCEVLSLAERLPKDIDISATDSNLYFLRLKNTIEPRPITPPLPFSCIRRDLH